MNYEEQMYEEVDEHFIGEEEHRLSRSKYFQLSRGNNRKEINEVRIKIGLKPLTV